MATNRRYNMSLRRRREGKTNYKRRLQLLKGRRARLVVRKTNKHTIVQVVQYAPDGDIIIASSSTSQLEKLGWKASTSNLPAAYLAGFIAGARALKAGVSDAIVDLGMQEPFHGGRLFAAAKGAVDAGMDIPLSEDAVPSEERIVGGHIDEKIAALLEQVKKKVGA